MQRAGPFWPNPGIPDPPIFCGSDGPVARPSVGAKCPRRNEAKARCTNSRSPRACSTRSPRALGARQVREVRLEVGKLSGVSVDSLRFCFELAAAGTDRRRRRVGHRRAGRAGPLRDLFGGVPAGRPHLAVRVRQLGRPGPRRRGAADPLGGGEQVDVRHLRLLRRRRSPADRSSPARARARSPARSRHDHPHDHDHPHGHPVRLAPAETETVTLETRVLAKNDELAAANRAWLAARGVVAINLMSSPGSGKTTLLERTVRALGAATPVCVIEGDQETTFDAERIGAAGAPVLQVNTGAGCHLDAADDPLGARCARSEGRRGAHRERRQPRLPRAVRPRRVRAGRDHVGDRRRRQAAEISRTSSRRQRSCC